MKALVASVRALASVLFCSTFLSVSWLDKDDIHAGHMSRKPNIWKVCGSVWLNVMLYVSNSLNDSNQRILNREKKKSVLWFKQPTVQEQDGGMLDLEVIYRKRVKFGLQRLLVHSVIWPHMGKECSKRNNSPVLFYYVQIIEGMFIFVKNIKIKVSWPMFRGKQQGWRQVFWLMI